MEEKTENFICEQHLYSEDDTFFVVTKTDEEKNGE